MPHFHEGVFRQYAASAFIGSPGLVQGPQDAGGTGGLCAAEATVRLLYNGELVDFYADFVGNGVFSDIEIVIHLKAEPEGC